MSEQNKNEIAIFGFSVISQEVLGISLFSKRHIIRHQKAQLCDNLTYLVSLTVIDIPIQLLEFVTPCIEYFI